MKVFTVLALFVLFFTLTTADGPCSVTAPNGESYDFTDANNQVKDYDAVDLPGKTGKSNNYFFQPCANTLINCVTQPASVVCQNDTNGAFHSCGLLAQQSVLPLNNTSQYPNATFLLVYSGGQNGRASAIIMICDPSTTGAVKSTSKVVQQATPYPTTYYIPFYTNVVCEYGSGGSGGGGGVIFIIIFFTLFGVYFIGGALFMKFARGASGKEIIPNVEFWADLPSLIKDGVMFIVNKARGRNDYSTVP